MGFDMKKQIRDTTVSEAIFDVLEQANKPLSGREIFNAMPHERLVKNLNMRDFWRHFGGFVKRKRQKVEKCPCPEPNQKVRKKQQCYCFKKETV